MAISFRNIIGKQQELTPPALPPKEIVTPIIKTVTISDSSGTGTTQAVTPSNNALTITPITANTALNSAAESPVNSSVSLAGLTAGGTLNTIGIVLLIGVMIFLLFSKGK